MAVTRRLLVLLLAAALVAVVTGAAGALDAIPERLPDGIVGQHYEADLEAEEGCIPYTFKHDSGNPPPGLVVDPTPTYSTGTIEGVPTTPGWYYWFIEVTDICGSVPSQGDWSIYIHPALVITTSALPAATPGRPYSAKLTAESGDKSILEWTLVGGSLPAGLTLSLDGTISGTPTTAGQFTIEVQVYDRNIRRTRKTLGLSVGSQLQAAAPRLPAGEVGIGYTARLRTNGGGFAPYRWSVLSGTLPRGLQLDETASATAGVITGRPTAAGSFAVRFRVTDAIGTTAETAGTFRIAARLVIGTASLPPGRVGAAYRTTLRARGGTRPLRWSVARGTLPPGVRLDPRVGSLTGEPQRAGTYRFTVRARDTLRGTDTQRLVLTVTP